MPPQPDGVDETVETDAIIFSEIAATNSKAPSIALMLCDN